MGHFPRELCLPGRNGQILCCRLELLSSGDLEKLLLLEKNVTDSLENPEFYSPSSREEWEQILEGEGFVLGARSGERLLYALAFFHPGQREENLGREFGISGEELEEVFHVEAALCLPEARGCSLHGTALRLGFEYLKETRRPRWIFSTVAPGNVPSLTAELHCGLVIGSLGRKYGGLLRYVLLWEKGRVFSNPEREASLWDFDGQQELFAQGWKGCRIDWNAGRLLFCRER